MSLFSMDFFKSKKKEEPKSINVVLPVTVVPIEYTVTVTVSPYKSVKMVNDVLTVVLPEGDIITKPSATMKDFEDVVKASSFKDIEKVVTIPEVVEEKVKAKAEEEKLIALQEGIEILKQLDDFDVIDDTVYIKGSNRSIPELVVSKFLEIVGDYQADIPSDVEDALSLDEEYQALKKFWLKCCLNPSAQSAEDLYTFLSHHQFKIDRHGNFYAYRRVVKVYSSDNNSDLVDFISNSYNKIKAVWKQSPRNFAVYKNNDEEYYFTKITEFPKDSTMGHEVIGNLKDLYKDLPNMITNRYTDQYTHSFDYRVGKSVSIPRDMGDDDNTISCSKGFHAASDKYDYSGFGNTPILMIINPIDVLAVA